MADKYKAIWLSPAQSAYFEKKGIVIKEFLLKHFPDMPMPTFKVGDSKPITIDGITYDSYQEAADAQGISKQAIHQRLQRAKKRKNKLIGS